MDRRGGDGTSFLQLNVAGPGNTGNAAWRVVRTADDPGANHTSGGAYAYRNAGPAAAVSYTSNECAEMQTPPLIVGTSSLALQYWERHQLAYHWDGVAVEYSVNGARGTTSRRRATTPDSGVRPPTTRPDGKT